MESAKSASDGVVAVAEVVLFGVAVVAVAEVVVFGVAVVGGTFMNIMF